MDILSFLYCTFQDPPRVLQGIFVLLLACVLHCFSNIRLIGYSSLTNLCKFLGCALIVFLTPIPLQNECKMLCLFKCQSSHQCSSRINRIKGAVSELDLRDFCQQPRFQKAFRSEGRAIICGKPWESSERACRVSTRLFHSF